MAKKKPAQVKKGKDAKWSPPLDLVSTGTGRDIDVGVEAVLTKFNRPPPPFTHKVTPRVAYFPVHSPLLEFQS
jgi:hypothetical protein